MRCGPLLNGVCILVLFLFLFCLFFSEGAWVSILSQNTIYILKQRIYKPPAQSVSGRPYEAKLKAASTIATISKVVQLNVKEFKCVSYALRSLPYGY